MSECICPNHLRFPHHACPCRTKNEELESLLSRERDRFGKLECDLLAKLVLAREALVRINNHDYKSCGQAKDTAFAALAKLDEAK